MYSYDNRWHAVVFRGLSRDDYAMDTASKLEIKIESSENSDGSKFAAAYAQPYYQTRHVITEEKITQLIEQQPRWVSINSLGSHVRPVSFQLSTDTTFVGEISGEQPSAGFETYKNWLDSLEIK